MLKELQEQIESRVEGEVIVLMRFGSHLYGTETPESDTDYKGVFMPSKRQVLLGDIPKSVSLNTKGASTKDKNTKDDVDCELYSLHYFLELAMKGETIGIDMLHAPFNWWDVWNDVWVDLHLKRALFYTKTLSSFVGYCRKQAAKYGIKGSRLSDMEAVIACLDAAVTRFGDVTRMHEIWEFLPTGDHIHFIEPDQKTPYPMYQVCGKKFLDRVTVYEVLDIISREYKKYGHRAQLAKKNEGIDWKAVSHALRAAEQLRQIYEDGDIVFPLSSAGFLRSVKNGERDFISMVGPALEYKISEVERLAEESGYPEQVDRVFWMGWLETTVEEVLFGR